MKAHYCPNCYEQGGPIPAPPGTHDPFRCRRRYLLEDGVELEAYLVWIDAADKYIVGPLPDGSFYYIDPMSAENPTALAFISEQINRRIRACLT